MMKFKRIIASALCGAVIAMSAAVPVLAKTFPDVEGDASVSWAKASINNMTDKGYIKGYDDGNFKPQQAITKVEALLLMSRIMGVDEADYEMSVDWAVENYEKTVTAINSQYPNELCYLMYLNALDLNDLRNYASSANANTSLLRWQAAYLMVKLTGRDADAQDLEIVDKSAYSDFDKIPEEAQKYVMYAKNSNIMNGMGKDENGKDYFSPDTTLTRAQMAVLLDRMIGTLGRTATLGTVSSVDYETGAIEIATQDGRTEGCEIERGTVIKFDGRDAKIDDIEKGDEIMVTFTNDAPRLIEAIAGQTVETVYGVIGQLGESGGRQQIIIRDPESDDKGTTYDVSPSCVFNIKGARGTFKDLKVGNNVEAVLTGGTVTTVTVNEKDTSVSGVFENLQGDSSSDSYIVLYDEKADKTTNYRLSTGNISVKRNGAIANLRDLNKGDNVTLTMTNGRVTEVSAKSDTAEHVGTIKEIILSDKPEITIEIDGKNQTYYMSTGTKVTVNNVDGTIYDLRPGNSASIVTDGSTLSSIESSATASYGKTSVSGKVQSVNNTLKVISVQGAGGATDTVYYDSSTTFLKSNGKSASSKDIVAGSNVSATGADTTGYFVATIIIID